MAVMQVAVESIVYILDMITLPQIIAPKTLRHFIQDLFGSKHILKLGMCVGSKDILPHLILWEMI